MHVRLKEIFGEEKANSFTRNYNYRHPYQFFEANGFYFLISTDFNSKSVFHNIEKIDSNGELISAFDFSSFCNGPFTLSTQKNYLFFPDCTNKRLADNDVVVERIGSVMINLNSFKPISVIGDDSRPNISFSDDENFLIMIGESGKIHVLEKNKEKDEYNEILTIRLPGEIGTDIREEIREFDEKSYGGKLPDIKIKFIGEYEFIVSHQWTILCFNIKNGKIKWEKQVSIKTPKLSVNNHKQIFCIYNEDHLCLFETALGFPLADPIFLYEILENKGIEGSDSAEIDLVKIEDNGMIIMKVGSQYFYREAPMELKNSLKILNDIELFTAISKKDGFTELKFLRNSIKLLTNE